MNKRIKHIKIITTGNFPYGRASANYLRNMAAGLSDYYDIEVLLPHGYNYGSVKNKNSSRLSSYDNYRWRYLSVINSPDNKIIRFILNSLGGINLFFFLILSRIRKKVDILIKYNINFTYNLMLLFVCKLTGIKLINIIPEFYNKPSGLNLSLTKWYNFYFGIRYFIRFSNGAIVLSDYLKKYLQSHGVSKSLIIVPNIIDPKPFCDSNKKKPNKDNFLTIGYTGTPTQKDGIDDLFSAFAIVLKYFPKTHLLIVGDVASNTIIPHLKNEAEKLGILNSITFTGLVDFRLVPGLINSCDILVLARPNSTASEAGFPTKLGEYMATKKPVVLTRVGDMGKYFGNGNNVVLVEPERVDSIANGISLLINNKLLRDEIGENGFKWMIRNLEYKTVAKRLNEYFRII